MILTRSLSNTLTFVMAVLTTVGLITGFRDLTAMSAGMGLFMLTLLVSHAVRRRSVKPCGQRLTSTGGNIQSHPCHLPRDGHTMHRCTHGDCSWGY